MLPSKLWNGGMVEWWGQGLVNYRNAKNQSVAG